MQKPVLRLPGKVEVLCATYSRCPVNIAGSDTSRDIYTRENESIGRCAWGLQKHR